MNIVNSVKNTILDNVKALRTCIKNFLTEEQNLPDDAPRKLREKQPEVFEALLKPEFSDEDIARGYFKLPTGFGKTVMFAHLTKSFLNETPDSKKKILVLVPRINLLEQTDEKFDKFIGVDTSYFYGKEKDTSSRVIISTYQSLSALLNNINKKDIDLVIADEAHHALGEITSKLFEDLQKYAPTIAFTATPNYSNDKKLANLFSKEIYSMTTIDAVQNNMLVPVKNILLRSSIEFDLSQVKKKNDGNFDYEKIASSISMETLSKEIAKAYLYGEDKDEEGNSFRFFGKKAMISCPNVKTAIAQAEKINELAGQVIAKPIFQHMGMSSRFGKFDETVEDFKNNKFLVACQVNTLTEGFDDTGVSISINYPTASAVREEQSAGRALRINEKDPNKVAYVIDTVFSVGNDDENPFATAQKAGQVLFSNVAGASVIFPENFKHKKDENDRDDKEKDKEKFPLPPPDIEIPEFKIFTDTEKLLQVFNNGKIQVKDENWYSANDLKNLLVGNSTKYKKCLEQAVKMPEFKDIVKLMQSGSRQSLCLHKDGLELFKDTFGIREIQKDLPQKTEDWYSSADLENSLGGSSVKYRSYLEQAVCMPEFKDTVKLMQSGKHQTLCIHKDGLELFKEIFGILDLPKKTESWYSSKDLSNLLCGDRIKHKSYLEQAVNMPEFKDTVKLMQSGPNQTLCIHKDGLELFKEIFDILDLPKKTESWYSSNDLMNLLGGSSKKYKSYLEQAVKMPEFKDKVKLIQCGTQQALCLHKDGLELFKDTFGILDLPKKTEGWYSSSDLKNLLVGSDTVYKNNLEKAVKMPEFENIVKLMKSGSRQSLCLHKDGLKLFKDTFGILDLPEKTEDWYSSSDFKKLLGGSDKKYADYLNQAAKMPEFENTVKLMQSSSRQTLCLHKDGLELFKDTFGIKEIQKDLLKKTEDWYSANDLVNLLGGRGTKYKKYLEQAVKMPEFENTVKLMQSSSHQALCLHKDGLELFIETFDVKEIQKDLLKKTEDWYSSKDLSNLLVGSNIKYTDYLEQAVKMPEFENIVKLMQSGKHQALCLHKDGLMEFVQKFKIKIRDPEMFEKAIKKIEQKIAMEDAAQNAKSSINKTIPDGKEGR